MTAIDPYAVPACCSPRHGIFADGRCVTCGKAEQHEPEKPKARWDNLTGSVRVANGLPVVGDSIAPTAAEPVIPPMTGGAIHHFTRTDAGQSDPEDCRHDWFAVTGGFRCHWCGLKLGREEP